MSRSTPSLAGPGFILASGGYLSLGKRRNAIGVSLERRPIGAGGHPQHRPHYGANENFA